MRKFLIPLLFSSLLLPSTLIAKPRRVAKKKRDWEFRKKWALRGAGLLFCLQAIKWGINKKEEAKLLREQKETLEFELGREKSRGAEAMAIKRQLETKIAQAGTEVEQKSKQIGLLRSEKIAMQKEQEEQQREFAAAKEQLKRTHEEHLQKEKEDYVEALATLNLKQQEELERLEKSSASDKELQKKELEKQHRERVKGLRKENEATIEALKRSQAEEAAMAQRRSNEVISTAEKKIEELKSKVRLLEKQKKDQQAKKEELETAMREGEQEAEFDDRLEELKKGHPVSLLKQLEMGRLIEDVDLSETDDEDSSNGDDEEKEEDESREPELTNRQKEESLQRLEEELEVMRKKMLSEVPDEWGECGTIEEEEEAVYLQRAIASAARGLPINLKEKGLIERSLREGEVRGNSLRGWAHVIVPLDFDELNFFKILKKEAKGDISSLATIDDNVVRHTLVELSDLD